MSRLHSFMTLFWIVVCSLGMPLEDDDDDDDDCWTDSPQPVNHVVSPTTTSDSHVHDSPSAAILAPYEHLPNPHPSPSQYPHATLPVPHRSQTPAILGTMFGIFMALVAFYFTLRYVSRRRRLVSDPFKDPPKSGFTAFRFRPRSTGSKRRLSDESWVSPVLPSLGSPVSPLSHDLELSRYSCPRRKLVPVTTPVCTPTDTEFGSRTEFADGDPISIVHAPPVRVPSPVYISPFSPSPSLSSSSSSLSPAPSTEPLTSPTPNPVRLSRLLSSTFRNTRAVDPPARPTTAYLIQTARSYAHAYRPSSATSTSLYTQPTLSAHLSGSSFYPGSTARDTVSTVTTSDTDTLCTVPHLRRAVAEDTPSISPFADPDIGTGSENGPVGTPLGLKLRLSDASEHARYRLRERERERERQERVQQRLSTESSESTSTSVETVRAVEEGRKEFKLRDSESVLREIGW